MPKSESIHQQKDLQPCLKAAPSLKQWERVWAGISRPMAASPNQDKKKKTEINKSKWTLGGGKSATQLIFNATSAHVIIKYISILQSHA